ncbi:MAG: hypothetical protein Q7S42_00895 [Candidatus Omnitrophota bacterium]|nr:hypothetical protein [Candidatus Omnitrophota bacterium]
MKSLKNVIMIIAIFAMVISFSGLTFAEMACGMHKEGKGAKFDKATCDATIKTLKDSAAALQISNPTLAKGLSDLANKKAEMMQKCMDMQTKHETKMNLLKDSAEALKQSNPALSQELQKMSEKKYMENEAMEKE